jgi:hypothetical protein
MRRAIAGAAVHRADRSWHGRLVVTVAAAVLVTGIIAAERVIVRYTPDAPTERTAGMTSTLRQEARHVRQLQFVTQNGTRVIWTFDSEFDVRAQR